ncbi:MAG: non-heme iron oxygenase ferredoxin subunit [Anaerolineae bacterium]|jgi:3-phenylpropionate/trans-cinnamate dioxygenase ferredoxin subunit
MTFKKAANVRDILPGRVQVVEVEGEEIALCNVGGEFFAVANLCTHDDGPLGEGQVMDHQVECPRHGARFDVRSGQVKALPAVQPIPTYEVKVEGDEVFVDL